MDTPKRFKGLLNKGGAAARGPLLSQRCPLADARSGRATKAMSCTSGRNSDAVWRRNPPAPCGFRLRVARRSRGRPFRMSVSQSGRSARRHGPIFVVGAPRRSAEAMRLPALRSAVSRKALSDVGLPIRPLGSERRLASGAVALVMRLAPLVQQPFNCSGPSFSPGKAAETARRLAGPRTVSRWSGFTDPERGD
jgi:hypothetical protein